MSFDEQSGRMNWKDEYAWILISIVSGSVLSLLFIYFKRFPGAKNMTVVFICCIAFYVLSILLRIQNYRGKIMTGKTAIDEGMLKFVFPVPGFILGIALMAF